jgi:hypothetical protein
VIEFGTTASAFDAVAPEEYVVDGKAKGVAQLGVHFK